MKEKNEFLYALKGICCILVVFIHCRFPGALGSVVDVLARIAVPIFFYINGRYMLNRGVDSLKIKIIHLIKTLLLVLVIYNLFSFLYYLINSNFYEWISVKCNIRETFSLFAFNSSHLIHDNFISNDHLWYVFALLYVLIIVLLTKGKLSSIGFIASQFPLLLYFILYYTFRSSIKIMPWYLLRNFFFIAIPFVYLGLYCKKSNDKIRDF